MSEKAVDLTFKSFRGSEGHRIIRDLASLRIEVFREFPYLYDGDIGYEHKYLGRYFSSDHSFVLTVWAGATLVGATTAILLADEDAMIKNAFKGSNFEPLSTVVYLGESIVRRNFRGHGLGKRFFTEREAFAKSLPGVQWTSFCAVVRPANDPRRPTDYHSPETLWTRQGYEVLPGITTKLDWKEIGEEVASSKVMQFWAKKI